MHQHWLFIWNVASHLVASMSGVASFLMSMWEHARKEKIESRVFFVVGVICLVIGFDQAWQDEHRNSQILIREKSAFAGEMEFWKEQSYSKDAILQRRDELLAKNYSALIGEQSTANSAQDSLVKLSSNILELNKPKLKWEAMALESPEQSPTNSSIVRSRWLLLTNKSVAPAEFVFSCSLPITGAELKVPGSAANARTVRLDDKHWGAKLVSPTWGPDSPILIVTDFAATTPSENINCSFHLNSVGN